MTAPAPAVVDMLAFAKAMRALAQFKPDRERFIREAFRRGRGEKWRLDDEAIRATVLPLLHELFERPAHSYHELQAHYEQAMRAHRGERAAASTVEALKYSLRQRGTAALKEPETRRRLGQLSEQQLVEVAGRLQRLKSHIARAWSEQEIDQLIAWRTEC